MIEMRRPCKQGGMSRNLGGGPKRHAWTRKTNGDRRKVEKGASAGKFEDPSRMNTLGKLGGNPGAGRSVRGGGEGQGNESCHPPRRKN